MNSEIVSFKQRVKNEAIKNAKLYKQNFIDYEYLICSKAFENGYHIIKADSSNYLHLIGVHTKLSPKDFFNKCINEDLEESDFNFEKPGKTEKSVKGSVREKISVLPHMVNIFQKELFAQDDFKKNIVECAFATTDNILTLGFVTSGRPKSLLKGNKLKENFKPVDLIFSKIRDDKSNFDKIIYGEKNKIREYRNIEKLISSNLIK